MNLNDFDWGELDEGRKNFIHNEIYVDKVYDYWRTVYENDVVVDIGSSVGPFSYKALCQGAQKVFVVEPSSNLIKTNLKNNSKFIIDRKDSPVVFVNRAVTDTTTDTLDLNVENKVDIYGSDKTFKSITFLDLRKKYDIEKINFLKIDCEGGEYDIFTEENCDFLKSNVDFIACEVHARFVDNGIEKFKTLLNILKQFPRETYKFMCNVDYVYSDVTDWISTDNGMNHILSQTEVMLYIKSR